SSVGTRSREARRWSSLVSYGRISSHIDRCFLSTVLGQSRPHVRNFTAALLKQVAKQLRAPFELRRDHVDVVVPAAGDELQLGVLVVFVLVGGFVMLDKR